MRGRRCAALGLALFATALLGAAAAAEDAPPETAAPSLPTAVLVLDASNSMTAKIGGTRKIEAVRSELGKAIGDYGDRLSFGLVAFGHRKASNCADSEILAKPGELTAETQEELLGGIKPKGQAPVAAALSDAAKAAQGPSGRLDILLLADSADSCDADLCSTAYALREKSPDLRVHVISLDASADDARVLRCAAAATGGEFVSAANVDELKQGVATVLDAIASPAPPTEAVATGGGDGAAPEGTVAAAKGDAETVANPPGDNEALATGPSPAGEIPAAEAGQSDIDKSGPAGPPAPSGETAVHKSAGPPQGNRPLPLAQPAPAADAPPPPADQPAPTADAPAPPANQPAPTTQAVAPPSNLPVPVTFKAMITEVGPKLQSGLTWRVYASKSSPDGHYKLLSTHREATPTAALVPGEYLVNAAYGLSNLTKKIKVEGGRSIEETFILNTGGLKLAAMFANGEPLPPSSVRFDILSDEEDQFGNRRTILADAKPGVIIRLNAGPYHIVSLYGDANATVKADVTVEPGKLTEATIKHNGAKTTFKLVQSLGGEALADTKWKILTSAGDVVKENAGALPTHILAAGSYAVVADHNGMSYTRKFAIEPSDTKQIEVAIDDGPTSPEALKALLDPPEPPPPASGTYAGEGPDPSVGFGFSAPADPNSPLINPGTLFRPSAR